MRIRGVLVAVVALGNAALAAADETSAVNNPQQIINTPLSWVCLNPQTRRYEALKAASLQQAQQAVGGDSTTECKTIPAAMEPERVARELNQRP